MDFQVPNLYPVLPEILLVVVGLVVLVVDLFLPRERKDLLAWIALAGLGFAGLVTLVQAGEEYTTFSGMFILDHYSVFFKFLFYLATALTVLISVRYIHIEGIQVGEYYSLVLFALTGMMVMASAADLITLYLGLELMAISVYILVGLTRGWIKSNEAALKYFILGAFSSGLLLYGISLIYGLSGTTQLKGIGEYLAGANLQDPGLVVAMLLVAVGFAFKIAAVPFHVWTPDAYEGAPTPVTAFMSVGPKAAAFAGFLRVFLEAFPQVRPDWTALLAVLAVLTMIVGNVVALAQTNVKRMLAYSSIAHAGYALVGVVAGGREGLAAVLLYMMIYLFMNMGAFGVMVLLRSGAVQGDTLRDYYGLARRAPWPAFLMLVFMFSLTGIPPTAGFIGKFYLFLAAVQNGYTYLAIIGLIFSVVSAAYYLRVVMVMYMREPEGDWTLAYSKPLSVALVVSLIGVVLLGITPSFLVHYALQSVLLP